MSGWIIALKVLATFVVTANMRFMYLGYRNSPTGSKELHAIMTLFEVGIILSGIWVL
jgi:hypothetical protein